MRRVYLETSVWGMIVPDQDPALRQPTLAFLAQCQRRIFLPHISAVVLKEIQDAPPAACEPIMRQIADVKPILLPMTSEVDSLAQRFVAEGVLAPRRLDDGRHVACALVNGIELLVSWNYRHLANVRKAERFNAVAVLAGVQSGLEIHTPLEVLSWE
jgi:hypothetical protein